MLRLDSCFNSQHRLLCFLLFVCFYCFAIGQHTPIVRVHLL
uniref:Uncharacterized protein n=1 Tax=Mammaliicoccus phage MSShimriz1 TaxID=3230127 RepID=A0AAU8GVB7_9VIRU